MPDFSTGSADGCGCVPIADHGMIGDLRTFPQASARLELISAATNRDRSLG